MRRIAVFVGVVVCVALGAVQIASSATYGDLASRVSLPALLHRVSPRLLRAAMIGGRAQAAAALHDGDLARARAIADSLGNDPLDEDLRGRIFQAEGQGQKPAALAAYVMARDVVRAQALIDGVAASDPVRAMHDEESLLAALRGRDDAPEVTALAWWRLGQLRAAAGSSEPLRRAGLGRAAEDAYEHALQLAPNEETYLLAAAYQSLANGEVAKAQRFYTRAAEVVPDSADAFAGLAWAEAARRDCPAALRDVSRARALRAAAHAVVRDPVDDPLVGPALRRCGA